MVLLARPKLEPKRGYTEHILQSHPRSADTCAMIELRITYKDLQSLRDLLLGHGQERCAVLLAARGHCSDGRDLMLAREVVLPADDDYIQRGFDHAKLRPDFVARVAKRARLQELSLVFIHTHPGYSPPHFSPVDDRGEEELAAFLVRRGQTYPHAALVLSQGGMCARVLGQNELLRVVSIGDRRVVEFDPEDEKTNLFEMFDRQIRAFGVDGQRILSALRVAVIGLGGTGSITVQQLAYLGVHSFILIDPDNIELTNLNRVVGACPDDIGRPKCEVAKRFVQQLSPGADVREVNGDIVHTSVARHLVDADVILCCTDSHGSRSVIQQVSYQYFIPCLDVGSTITTDAGEVTGIFGRVQLLGPDQPCLWCSQLLNPEEVRRDMMNELERKADPYIQGSNVPAPSVISINGTVVSMAVTMLLGLVTSVPVQSRHLIYNAKTPSIRSVRSDAKDDCFICSRSGAFGLGDAQKFFARND